MNRTKEEIAEKYSSSLHTVKRHFRNQLNKTGYRNRLELAVNAKVLGLVIHEDKEKGKLMKIISKNTVKLVVLVLLSVTLLGGCVPKKYSESQEEALVQACLPAINEFLAKRCGEYELGEFHLQNGLIEPENALLGRFGSNVVRGCYTVQGNTWDLIYDRETGDFYTGELLEKLMKQEEERMLEYLKDELPEEDLRDFRLTALDIYYLVQSHDIRIDSSTTADTYVYITNVLPAGITEADLSAFAARDFDGGIVSWINCHYNSDRANALTKEAFEKFFTDNPAYRVGQYLHIDNDNPSAKEESTDGSETDTQNVLENAEAAGAQKGEEQKDVWFRPEPVGKDADCRIEYENGIIFARRPNFTESDGIVTMHFNAIDWYRVRVIQKEDAERYFPDEEILAQSSNLKVFRSYENQGFAYSCLFVPDDGSDYVFLFETDTPPEAEDFGFGFGDCIHYYEGGKEVFPDTELN